jgi:hypothetical protein
MAELRVATRPHIELPGALRSPVEAWRNRAAREEGPTAVVAFRALKRSLLLHRPEAVLVAAGALVLVLLVLDFIPPTNDGISFLDAHYGVALRLLEHLLVALLVAAAAYYWVLGRKRQRALKAYRDRVRKNPRSLVEWYLGEEPGLRRRTSKRLSDEIINSRDTAVAVVKGRAGTGRTSFIVELTRHLAAREHIPIPVLARRDGSFNFEKLAKQKFYENIDLMTSSNEQADAIWHFARGSRAVVVLVDGLDKDVLERLKRDTHSRAADAIQRLQDNHVAVVLATTLDMDSEFDLAKELGINGSAVLREDLDRFTHAEAVEYLGRALGDAKQAVDERRASNDGPGSRAPRNRPVAADACSVEPATGQTRAAIAALAQLHDPRDESLVDPFYLDLIARLARNNVSLVVLPSHTDQWRAAIIARYLDAIEAEEIELPPASGNPDLRRPVSRGANAALVARTMGEEMAFESFLALPRRDLDRLQGDAIPDLDLALDDAAYLNLVRKATKYVSFPSDDLGAFLVASGQADANNLLASAKRAAESSKPDLRHDRFALTALTFWHLGNRGDEGREAFDDFLVIVEGANPPRPRLVAAAVRILDDCENLGAFADRVSHVARNCVDALCDKAGPSVYERDPTGPLRLVHALGRWQVRHAHRLLWRFATSRNLDLEWPAVHALATLKGDAGETLSKEIHGVLDHAQQASWKDRSREDSAVGNELASLAWLLPTFLARSEQAPNPHRAQLTRLTELCLDEQMSPLRGEMAVAQGLKLAVVNGYSENIRDVEELLFARPLRFWHARLVLVHALFAHACRTPASIDAYREKLEALKDTEEHPLAERGIEFAVEGLSELAPETEQERSARVYEYIWRHEHEAVTSVEQAKWQLSRLAADVVLLSNMTYRLWAEDGVAADRVASHALLPSCICDGDKRERLLDATAGGCDCQLGLCACKGEPAVRGTWARFTEGFCREQARLAAQHRPPAWIGDRHRNPLTSGSLEKYWSKQAASILSGYGNTPADAAGGKVPSEARVQLTV